MNSRPLLRATLRRLRAPATWVAAAAFTAVWVALRRISGVPMASIGNWEYFVPALFVLGHVTLAPLPWQWPGGDRGGPGPWRGGLQALAWDAAWVGLLLWGLRDVVKPRTPASPGTARAAQPEPLPARAGGTADQDAVPLRPDRSTAQPPPPARPGGSTQQPPSRPRPGGNADQPPPPPRPGGNADLPPPPPRPGGTADQPPPPPRPGGNPDQPPPQPRPGGNADQPPPRPVGTAGQPPPRAGADVERPAAQAQAPSRADGAAQPPPGLPQELNLLMLNLPFALILGWFLAGKEASEAREAGLRDKEREARALALQAQLHPHALYNVLAGLAELAHEDADATEQAIISLVDLLRMLTRHGAAPRMALAQERTLLKRYLAIESLRLGDRLRVQWDWPPWADAVALPPLLLQPLVENAVKHGIAPCPQGGELRIGVQRQGRALLLRVANTGAPFHPNAPAGTGLTNLRERLSLLPGLEGSLSLRADQGWTLAELRLRATMDP